MAPVAPVQADARRRLRREPERAVASATQEIWKSVTACQSSAATCLEAALRHPLRAQPGAAEARLPVTGTPQVRTAHSQPMMYLCGHRSARSWRPRCPAAHRMPTRGFSATTGVRQRARTLHAPVQGALCPLNSAPSPLTTTPFSTQAPPTLRGAAAPARARAYVQPRSDLPPRVNLLARLAGGVAAPRGAGLAGGAAAASPRLGSGGVIG